MLRSPGNRRPSSGAFKRYSPDPYACRLDLTMFRLIFTLAVALYAGFAIWGVPGAADDDPARGDDIASCGTRRRGVRRLSTPRR